MRAGRLYRNSELLLDQTWRADTVLTRARGLLGRSKLQQGQGLMITPCSSIHTFGMTYAIDVVFLDRANRIVKLCADLPRRRLALALGARWTLEMLAGEISRLQLVIGDELHWRPV